MTHLFRQLQRLESRNQAIRTAVIGAGFMGRGLIYQLSRTPGMFPSLLVVRNSDSGIDAYRACGFNPQDIVVSDNRRTLEDAVQKRRPAITADIDIATSVIPIDVFIEATGHVEYGARCALSAILHRKHFVSLNAETDARSEERRVGKECRSVWVA